MTERLSNALLGYNEKENILVWLLDHKRPLIYKIYTQSEGSIILPLH